MKASIRQICALVTCLLGALSSECVGAAKVKRGTAVESRTSKTIGETAENSPRKGYIERRVLKRSSFKEKWGIDDPYEPIKDYGPEEDPHFWDSQWGGKKGKYMGGSWEAVGYYDEYYGGGWGGGKYKKGGNYKEAKKGGKYKGWGGKYKEAKKGGKYKGWGGKYKKGKKGGKYKKGWGKYKGGKKGGKYKAWGKHKGGKYKSWGEKKKKKKKKYHYPTAPSPKIGQQKVTNIVTTTKTLDVDVVPCSDLPHAPGCVEKHRPKKEHHQVKKWYVRKKKHHGKKWWGHHKKKWWRNI